MLSEKTYSMNAIFFLCEYQSFFGNLKPNKRLKTSFEKDFKLEIKNKDNPIMISGGVGEFIAHPLVQLIGAASGAGLSGYGAHLAAENNQQGKDTAFRTDHDAYIAQKIPIEHLLKSAARNNQNLEDVRALLIHSQQTFPKLDEQVVNTIYDFFRNPDNRLLRTNPNIFQQQFQGERPIVFIKVADNVEPVRVNLPLLPRQYPAVVYRQSPAQFNTFRGFGQHGNGRGPKRRAGASITESLDEVFHGESFFEKKPILEMRPADSNKNVSATTDYETLYEIDDGETILKDEAFFQENSQILPETSSRYFRVDQGEPREYFFGVAAPPVDTSAFVPFNQTNAFLVFSTAGVFFILLGLISTINRILTGRWVAKTPKEENLNIELKGSEFLFEKGFENRTSFTIEEQMFLKEAVIAFWSKSKNHVENADSSDFLQKWQGSLPSQKSLIEREEPLDPPTTDT